MVFECRVKSSLYPFLANYNYKIITFFSVSVCDDDDGKLYTGFFLIRSLCVCAFRLAHSDGWPLFQFTTWNIINNSSAKEEQLF